MQEFSMPSLAIVRTFAQDVLTEALRHLERNRVLVIMSIAALQCLTLYNYQGEKVDESELVYFAVGFLGGDLDPGWYGYGSFGMYLLGFIYMLVGWFSTWVGCSVDFVDYGSSLFDSPLFILLARYLYAIVGVMTVYVYVKVSEYAGVRKSVRYAFFLVAILMPFSLHYANYIRSDSMVALFIPLIIIAFKGKYKFQRRIILASMLLGAAITTKITAIFLGPIFIYFLYKESSSAKHFLRGCLFSGFWVVIFSTLFQPYHTIFDAFMDTYTRRIATDSTFNFGKVVYSGVGQHVAQLIKIYTQNITVWPLLLLVLTPFFILKRSALKGVLIAIVICFVFPYMFSSELSSYWFIPTFLPLILLAVITMDDICKFLAKLLGSDLKWVTPALTLVFFALVLVPHYRSFAATTLTYHQNKELAKDWLLSQSEYRDVMIDAHFDHVMPKLYSKDDIKDNREISNAFTYNRSKNEFLKEAFDAFLERKVKGSSFDFDHVRAFDPLKRLDEVKAREGKAMLVSPDVYNRFLRRKITDLSGDKLEELLVFQRYYNYIKSHKLIVRFEEGDGPILEVYSL